jgi:pilus assembly protein CpaB
MRTVIVICSALLVAGGSGYYLLTALQPEAQPVAAEPVEAPRSVQVFVPAVPLAAGSILTAQSLTSVRMDEGAVTPEMIVSDEVGQALLVGSVARQSLAEGVPIARSTVVQPGDRGFLAAVLSKGRRAISIPISETAGLSGLVMPGDRVDIILTYSIAGNVIDAGRDIKASETVLTNLRVLALDQRLQAGRSVAQQVTPEQVAAPARTATLEVSPQEAEMLTLATQLGELSLVLNSVSDGGEPDAAEDGAPAVASVAASRRALTLDSEVTSLLKRELALLGELGPDPALDAAVPDGTLRPLPERITRVQVVRGIGSSAMEFSGQEAGTAGPAPVAGAEEAAAPAPAATPPLD